MKNIWKATNHKLLPDFIIGGAMKSGTSTLHTILSHHPDIFIPSDEIHFFDIDNILQHPDFNFYENGKWVYQSMEKNPEKMWKWYHNKFEKHEHKIKGEDSTTYLASKIAAKRIGLQDKKIKIIFVLRQPTLRAYSNYLHLLRSGRATLNFHDTLHHDPFRILNRSLYLSQLKDFYAHIPKERIKILLFEDLIKDSKKVLKTVCDFLEIDSNNIPKEAYNTHVNKSLYPKNLDLFLRFNSFRRKKRKSPYNKILPFKSLNNKRDSLVYKLYFRINYLFNPLTVSPEPIPEETKVFLDEYFYKELKGIDELVGKEILSKWFK